MRSHHVLGVAASIVLLVASHASAELVVGNCRLKAGAQCAGASLGAIKAAGLDLSNANLRGTHLAGADLRGANLSGANLIGANLSNANLEGAQLTGAKLTKANLWQVNLAKARLVDADLEEAILGKSSLKGADARRANFGLAGLAAADLSGANLEGAILGRAKLDGADLFGANLTNANLFYATVYKAGFTQAMLAGAKLEGTGTDYGTCQAGSVGICKLRKGAPVDLASPPPLTVGELQLPAGGANVQVLGLVDSGAAGRAAARKAAWGKKDAECYAQVVAAVPSSGKMHELMLQSGDPFTHESAMLHYIGCMQDAGFLVNLRKDKLREYVSAPEQGVCYFEGPNFRGRWQCHSSEGGMYQRLALNPSLGRFSSVRVYGNACWMVGIDGQPVPLDGGHLSGGKASKAALRPETIRALVANSYTGSFVSRCDAPAQGAASTPAGLSMDDTACFFEHPGYKGRSVCAKPLPTSGSRADFALNAPAQSVWVRSGAQLCWVISTDKWQALESGSIPEPQIKSAKKQIGWTVYWPQVSQDFRDCVARKRISR